MNDSRFEIMMILASAAEAARNSATAHKHLCELAATDLSGYARAANITPAREVAAALESVARSAVDRAQSAALRAKKDAEAARQIVAIATGLQAWETAATWPVQFSKLAYDRLEESFYGALDAADAADADAEAAARLAGDVYNCAAVLTQGKTE